MPPRNLPLRHCDLCGFSTKNHFIFSRHHKRCLRENGGHARQLGPQRVTEHVPDTHDWYDSQLCGTDDGEISFSVSGEAAFESNTDDPSHKPASTPPLVQDFTRLRPKRAETQDLDPESSSDTTHGPARTIRSSTSTIEQDLEEDGEHGLEAESEINDVEDQPSTSSTGSLLPPPNVSRNYRCAQCGFATTKSKMFLYHQIDQHNARISIFPCNFCEYASRYKHKLGRHITFAHKVQVSAASMNAENLKAGTGVRMKRLTSALTLTRTQRSVGSIGKNKSLSALLGKLRGKGKVTDPRLSAFYTDLPTHGWAGLSSDQFKCKLCLFTGKNKGQMMRHVYACHINGRVFRCNLCNYKTQSQIDFYAHKKKHSTTNATVHKCSECAYATDFKPNFDRHMSNHGSTKPHK